MSTVITVYRVESPHRWGEGTHVNLTKDEAWFEYERCVAFLKTDPDIEPRDRVELFECEITMPIPPDPRWWDDEVQTPAAAHWLDLMISTALDIESMLPLASCEFIVTDHASYFSEATYSKFPVPTEG